MKRTLTLAALAFLAPACVADNTYTTWQPGVKAKAGYTRSGYEIPGCAHYESVGTSTYQICDERSVANSKKTGRPIILDRADATAVPPSQ